MAAPVVLCLDNTVIYELLGSGDNHRLEAMLTLYTQFFPQYSQYVPRMRQRAHFPCDRDSRCIVRYWLVEVDAKPVGFRIFRYVRSRRCGLAHALMILPNYREHQVDDLRLSMFLVRQCLQQVIEDAERLGDPPVYGMVNEVESEQLMHHYTRYGAVELPVQYLEPVFSSSKNGAELATFLPMHLGFLAAPGQQLVVSDVKILRNFVLAFLVDHYGLSEDHEVVQSVLQSISTAPTNLVK